MRLIRCRCCLPAKLCTPGTRRSQARLARLDVVLTERPRPAELPADGGPRDADLAAGDRRSPEARGAARDRKVRACCEQTPCSGRLCFEVVTCACWCSCRIRSGRASGTQLLPVARMMSTTSAHVRRRTSDLTSGRRPAGGCLKGVTCVACHQCMCCIACTHTRAQSNTSPLCA